jgi:hypothetical protein
LRPRPLNRAGAAFFGRLAEAKALDHRFFRAFARQIGENRYVIVAGLARQPVGAAGDLAQVVDSAFTDLLVGEKPLKHGIGQGLGEFQPGELLAVPDDPAILVL